MQCPQHGGAGTKLQAVMENLQRQQAARLALEENLTLAQTDVHSFVESHISRSVRAFHRYQSAMQDVLRAEVTNSLSRVPLSHLKVRRAHGKADAPRPPSPTVGPGREDVGETAELMTDEEDFEVNRCHLRQPTVVGLCAPPLGSPMSLMAGVPTCVSPARCAESPSGSAPQQHGWTYEEQFKQVRQPDKTRGGASMTATTRSKDFPFLKLVKTRTFSDSAAPRFQRSIRKWSSIISQNKL